MSSSSPPSTQKAIPAWRSKADKPAAVEISEAKAKKVAPVVKRGAVKAFSKASPLPATSGPTSTVRNREDAPPEVAKIIKGSMVKRAVAKSFALKKPTFPAAATNKASPAAFKKLGPSSPLAKKASVSELIRLRERSSSARLPPSLPARPKHAPPAPAAERGTTGNDVLNAPHRSRDQEAGSAPLSFAAEEQDASVDAAGADIADTASGDGELANVDAFRAKTAPPGLERLADIGVVRGETDPGPSLDETRESPAAEVPEAIVEAATAAASASGQLANDSDRASVSSAPDPSLPSAQVTEATPAATPLSDSQSSVNTSARSRDESSSRQVEAPQTDISKRDICATIEPADRAGRRSLPAPLASRVEAEIKFNSERIEAGKASWMAFVGPETGRSSSASVSTDQNAKVDSSCPLGVAPPQIEAAASPQAERDSSRVIESHQVQQLEDTTAGSLEAPQPEDMITDGPFVEVTSGPEEVVETQANRMVAQPSEVVDAEVERAMPSSKIMLAKEVERLVEPQPEVFFAGEDAEGTVTPASVPEALLVEGVNTPPLIKAVDQEPACAVIGEVIAPVEPSALSPDSAKVPASDPPEIQDLKTPSPSISRAETYEETPMTPTLQAADPEGVQDALALGTHELVSPESLMSESSDMEDDRRLAQSSPTKIAAAVETPVTMAPARDGADSDELVILSPHETALNTSNTRLARAEGMAELIKPLALERVGSVDAAGGRRIASASHAEHGSCRQAVTTRDGVSWLSDTMNLPIAVVIDVARRQHVARAQPASLTVHTPQFASRSTGFLPATQLPPGLTIEDNQLQASQTVEPSLGSSLKVNDLPKRPASTPQQPVVRYIRTTGPLDNCTIVPTDVPNSATEIRAETQTLMKQVQDPEIPTVMEMTSTSLADVIVAATRISSSANFTTSAASLRSSTMVPSTSGVTSTSGLRYASSTRVHGSAAPSQFAGGQAAPGQPAKPPSKEEPRTAPVLPAETATASTMITGATPNKADFNKIIASPAATRPGNTLTQLSATISAPAATTSSSVANITTQYVARSDYSSLTMAPPGIASIAPSAPTSGFTNQNKPPASAVVPPKLETTAESVAKLNQQAASARRGLPVEHTLSDFVISSQLRPVPFGWGNSVDERNSRVPFQHSFRDATGKFCEVTAYSSKAVADQAMSQRALVMRQTRDPMHRSGARSVPRIRPFNRKLRAWPRP